MKTIYTILGFCIFSFSACKVAKIMADEKTPIFPKDWYGTYNGQLEIITAKGIEQTMPMELKIQPGDSIHRTKFTISYNGEPRKYELIQKDASKGEFLMDEKNGIFIHTRLLGNTLYSRFDVQGSDLISMYRNNGDEIISEIVVSKAAILSSSGMKGDSIPKVDDFMMITTQRAVLRKK
jgi:hypothetical protein